VFAIQIESFVLMRIEWDIVVMKITHVSNISAVDMNLLSVQGHLYAASALPAFW
jgi:hypothetical protein